VYLLLWPGIVLQPELLSTLRQRTEQFTDGIRGLRSLNIVSHSASPVVHAQVAESLNLSPADIDAKLDAVVIKVCAWPHSCLFVRCVALRRLTVDVVPSAVTKVCSSLVPTTCRRTSASTHTRFVSNSPLPCRPRTFSKPSLLSGLLSRKCLMRMLKLAQAQALRPQHVARVLARPNASPQPVLPLLPLLRHQTLRCARVEAHVYERRL